MRRSELVVEPFRVDNGQGWSLELVRSVRRGGPEAGRRPLLMVPGYAMNSFILGYHPSDVSMVEHLALAGVEVWTCNLRGQGGSAAARGQGPPGPSTSRVRRYGLAELALVDLPAVIAELRRRTTTGTDRVDLVGCSLGASLLYAWLAHHPADHGAGAVIAVGGPLRWEAVHPAMALAFTSPRLAGALPFRGTRALAAASLPWLSRAPGLLSLYMNARRIDLSNPAELARTVEDPVPWINRQVAHWVRQRDLVVGGLNICEAIGAVDLPVLVVMANRDGIVPASTARSVQRLMRPGRVQVLEVGDERNWYAHADLFIGRDARRQVFEPMERWLAEHRS